MSIAHAVVAEPDTESEAAARAPRRGRALIAGRAGRGKCCAGLEPPAVSEVALGERFDLSRTVGLGRIAAQTAKQVLYQKVREAERDNVYNEYYPKVGELMNGTVKRFERGDMIVDLGRSEAIIPRDQQSRAERYGQGERIRAILFDVHRNPKGPQLVLSRTDPRLLIRLFEMEVPEIYDGTVVIRRRRQPGERAKVAVRSRERDVDPAALRGMRGQRVQSIMRSSTARRSTSSSISTTHHVRSERARSGQDHPRLADPPRRHHDEPRLRRRGRPALARDRQEGPERAPPR
jgi:hypothetical protein